MRVIGHIALVCACVTLTACSLGSIGQSSSNTQQGQGEVLGVNTKPGVPIGGSLAGAMDAFDRTKLNRALDKSPGTTTEWTNENSGVSYAVTPVRKTTVNGNSLCREYQVVSTKGANKQQMNGTACVASDGAWSEV